MKTHQRQAKMSSTIGGRYEPKPFISNSTVRCKEDCSHGKRLNHWMNNIYYQRARITTTKTICGKMKFDMFGSDDKLMRRSGYLANAQVIEIII